MVCNRRLEKLEKVKADLEKQHGIQALAVECDVTDEAQIKQAKQAVMDKFGRVNILINNAGVGGMGGAGVAEWQKDRGMLI